MENNARIEKWMRKIWNLPVIEFTPFNEIEEKRPVLLVTSAPAWDAVKGILHLNVTERVEPITANLKDWDGLQSKMNRNNSEVVYAVGGGLAADAAKYMAVKLCLPLVVLPTALSVDAFVTSASGVRKNGCVYYIETKSPERLVLDFDVIAAAPAAIRTAGICDVLSIATGCWDWKYAQVNGKNSPGMEFIPWVHENAMSILRGALDCAEAAGEADRHGLKQLLDVLCMEVQLCNQIGHSRPEEGTEHYFAYAVENHIGHGLPHGELVGPGILIAAGLQDQDPADLESAMRLCNVPLDRIPGSMVDQTLRKLPSYCQKHGLAYGIAHDLGK
jgi:glycerol-1-phosphate dehydrogenase [NAD(P)+]